MLSQLLRQIGIKFDPTESQEYGSMSQHRNLASDSKSDSHTHACDGENRPNSQQISYVGYHALEECL